MNKKLVASSVALCLAAMAGCASAATVDVYARMDMGLNYFKDAKGGENVSMASSQNSTSRFGLKGKHKLDNGMEAGFKFEANVDGDTGAGVKKGRFFYREAILYVKGDFGEFGMGRCGLIDSGNGTYGLIEDDFVAFGTGWGETVGTNDMIMMGLNKRTDNVLTYKSPEFAGTTFYVQGSTQMDSIDEDYEDEADGSDDATKYLGVGAKYDGGAFKAFMTASLEDLGKADMGNGGSHATTISAGVMYDFGAVNLKFATQYFDKGALGEEEGMGYVLSATAPLAGGKLYGYLGYADAEEIGDSSVKIENQMASLGYEYKLSKQVHVYVAGSYVCEEKDNDKDETFEAMTGLVVKF